MWSGPRNISTAMMRSFDARGDTLVSDEPMYGHFLLNTQTDHPLKSEVIASMQTDREKLRNYLTTHNPDNLSIWYQKQMTQHILDDDDLKWTLKLKNAFLIRNPRDVILSYLKKFKLEDESLIGFFQLKRIFDFTKENLDLSPVVIDAKDILLSPSDSLSSLCNALEIDYSGKMLSWKRGYRKTDGIWASHWYDSVVNTTEFIFTPRNNEDISKEYQDIYRRSMDIYEELYDYRIR